MRNALILILLLSFKFSNAQNNTYLADLSTLKAILEKTPSFKAQIKGEKLTYYTSLYNRLASDSSNIQNSYMYFYNLSQLLFPLRDNHLGFYQLPDYDNFKTKESIDRFTESTKFLEYPSSPINIDSLRTELSGKSIDSIEGIYYYDKYYSVGLFKSAKKEYTGVVLDSDTKLWFKGQTAIHLYQYGSNLYKAIYGHPLYKSYILQTIEKYQHHSLINSYFHTSYCHCNYSKHRQRPESTTIPQALARFGLKNINSDVQYLLLRTFQADAATMKESQSFYDDIKASLRAPYLVLDLRNNEGGAQKEMKKYFSLLKRYVHHGHLYILINNGTMSQAEIFTLKLRKLSNVTTVGQTTRGMLTYGSNYGKREKLPSGNFEIYPTDMNGGTKLLKYEDHGIKPDILTDDANWMEKINEIIRKK